MVTGARISLAPACSNLRSWEQMQCIEETTYDIVGTFRSPGHCDPLNPFVKPLVDLCHTKKETSFLLTIGNSEISKEDSMSSFVKISHLYGTSYWSTCKNPVLIRLPLATLATATSKLSSRQLKNGLPLLHLMISSNTELMLIVNRWAVAKCLTTNSAAGILPSMTISITKLPEAKCIRKCVKFICWNAFSVLNIWLLAQQCKVNFPPESRWMDCTHCNA